MFSTCQEFTLQLSRGYGVVPDMTRMACMTDINLVWVMEGVKHTVLLVAVKPVEHIPAMAVIIYLVGPILVVVLIHLCIQAAVWVVDTYLAVAQDPTIKLFVLTRML